MRILITGSRDWTARDDIFRAIFYAGYAAQATPDQVTVVHGGARGADAIAGEVAAGLGCHIEIYQADWAKYGKAAGPIRNAEMVKLGADVCLAFPLGPQIRADGSKSGTRDCMDKARAAGIPVVTPEGPWQP